MMRSAHDEIKAVQNTFIFQENQTVFLLNQAQKWLLRGSSKFNGLTLEYYTDNNHVSIRLFLTTKGWVCSDLTLPPNQIPNQIPISSAEPLVIQQLFKFLETIDLQNAQYLTRSFMLQPTPAQMDKSGQYNNFKLVLANPPSYQLRNVLPEVKSTDHLTKLEFDVLNSAHFFRFTFEWNDNNSFTLELKCKTNNEEHPLISLFAPLKNITGLKVGFQTKDTFYITIDDDATHEGTECAFDMFRLLSDLDKNNSDRINHILHINKMIDEKNFNEAYNDAYSDPILLYLLGEKFHKLEMNDWAIKSYEAISTLKDINQIKNSDLRYYENAQYRLGQIVLAKEPDTVWAETRAITYWLKAGKQGIDAIHAILLSARQAKQENINLKKEIAALKQINSEDNKKELRKEEKSSIQTLIKFSAIASQGNSSVDSNNNTSILELPTENELVDKINAFLK